MWCIPEVDGTYVARMEDVLDLDAEAPDPKRPAVVQRRVNIGTAPRPNRRKRPLRSSPLPHSSSRCTVAMSLRG